VSTPHARGSTFVQFFFTASEYVYPACAGIHPVVVASQFVVYCLPRMRGDPPFVELYQASFEVSTPHARGSTVMMSNSSAATVVYPACAGIHLRCRRAKTSARGLPRMRGDPPAY